MGARVLGASLAGDGAGGARAFAHCAPAATAAEYGGGGGAHVGVVVVNPSDEALVGALSPLSPGATAWWEWQLTAAGGNGAAPTAVPAAAE